MQFTAKYFTLGITRVNHELANGINVYDKYSSDSDMAQHSSYSLFRVTMPLVTIICTVND